MCMPGGSRLPVLRAWIFCLEAGERGQGFSAFLQQDDAFDDVGILVASDFAEARLMAFADRGDIA